MHNRTHSYGFFLVVSIIGAFVTASAYMVGLQVSLPPTDLAYGQSLWKIWDDPFVRAVAGPVAFLSGLVASPLLYFCLRRRRLSVALPIVFVSVLATVTPLTALSPLAGWFGSYAALVVSCIVCSRIRAISFDRSNRPT